MAKYIELVGISGIGKSTTYKQLISTCNADDNLIPIEKIPLNFSLVKRNKSKIKFLLKKFLSEIVNDPTLQIDIKNRSIESFIKENPAFVDIIWKALGSFPKEKSGNDHRLDCFNYILNICYHLQKIKEFNSNKFVVLDEGVCMISKYNIDVNSDSNLELQLQDVYDNIVLPAAIIYFSGDIQLSIERVKERELRKGLGSKIIDDLELRNEKEYIEKLNTISLKIFKNKNIPILEIDSSASPESKAQTIRQFVNTL